MVGVGHRNRRLRSLDRRQFPRRIHYNVDMDKACRVDGCPQPVRVIKESLCGRHYERLRRHGDPEAWKKPRRPICSVDGCEFRAVGHGLCDLHYRRRRRYGTTDAPPARPTVCAAAAAVAVAAFSLCERHYRRNKKGQGDRYCRRCGKQLDPNIHWSLQYCDDSCRKQEEAIKRREMHRTRWLRRYGLTPTQFEDLLAAQGGRCAICRTDQIPKRGSWHVDHEHTTCKVRGILCHGCNVALGHFNDDPVRLRAAAAYVEAYMI